MSKFDEESLQRNINSVIEEYCSSWDKQSIDQLLKLQDRLSWYNFFARTLYSEAYADNANQHTNRKLSSTKAFLKKKAEKLEGDKWTSDKLAEQLAISETSPDLLSEISSEIRMKKLQVMIEWADRVIGAISQRISHMKQEKRETKSN